MNTPSPEPGDTLSSDQAANSKHTVEWLAQLPVAALRPVKVSLVVLATIAVLWALQWGSVFLIPCAVALCMTFWLMPLVDGLQRIRVPRLIGAALVLLVLMGGVGGAGYALRDDVRGFAASLPEAARHARVAFNEAVHDPNGWLHHWRKMFVDRGLVAGPKAIAPNVPTDMETAVVRGSTTAMAAAANVGIVLFLIYLMLASGDLFKRKLMVVVGHHATPQSESTLGRKRLTVQIINEVAAQFQRYLGVLAVTNIIIGFLIWAAFAALGMEHSAVWGAAAAVLHIVPYGGPAVIAIASFFAAALQFDSLSHAVLVAGTSLLIFGLIGMWLATWLAGRASNMNAVAVFIGLMFWGWLWGIPGLLLGTPLTMAFKVIADRVECLSWLGTLLGDAPKRERKSIEDRLAVPVAAALTESAATGDPAFATGEVAAETVVMAREVQRTSVNEEKVDDSGALLPA
jgi:predicted PurR-regulated permease PerM